MTGKLAGSSVGEREALKIIPPDKKNRPNVGVEKGQRIEIGCSQHPLPLD